MRNLDMRQRPEKIFSRYWNASNRAVIFNATSLIGTTAVTSLLGFLYWWIAARHFSPGAVGFASAALSAMTLLGTICVLGLGTLLIGEIPRQQGNALSLITAALIVAGGTGGAVSFLFALVAPYVSTELRPLGQSVGHALLFALGASLTAISLVLDQALIGLIRGELQFWRNTLFAIAKLGALVIVTIWLANTAGITIYATWVIGNVISLGLIVGYGVRRGHSLSLYWPKWQVLHGLGRAAFRHHILNLVLLGPTLVLPLVVTLTLSASSNAYFYTAWMMAGFIWVIPIALTTVLYAVGAAGHDVLASKVRFTLGLSMVLSLLTNTGVLITGDFVLRLFGSAYASNAETALVILSLDVFPLIISEHYVTICRIYDHTSKATTLMTVGVILKLAAAIIGAKIYGLSGLSLGFLTVDIVIAVIVLPAVYTVASGRQLFG